MKKQLIALTLCVLMLAGFSACAPKAPEPVAQQPSELSVSAAASLKETLTELQTLYNAKKPNVTLNFNFAASGDLQTQIENGAPVDVFISASTKQTDKLKDGGLLLDGSTKNLLVNKVVLVVPADAETVTFDDVATGKVKQIAIGEPSSVPAGQYAKEIFESLGTYAAIEKKAVFCKDVTQVLTYTEQGEVDAGVVYLTDAKKSAKVKVAADAPEGSHKKVIYPVTIIKASKNVEGAQDFVAFLSTPEAKTVFEKYGFTMAE